MAADLDKLHFRLVLLGSNETGKTSILNRFLSKKFEAKYRPTVEDLFCKTFDLGSIEIKVDFLDTSGSMQFPAMRRLSISTGNAFLIVYALDDDRSFEVLKQVIAEIRDIRPDFQEIPMVIAGNKCDIARERRKVLKETVSNYIHYELPRLRVKLIECSCRDNINIENIFRAYLSLAKVSVSSGPLAAGCSGVALTAEVQSDTPALAASVSTILERRAGSMKQVLGVRKSCDASIQQARRRENDRRSDSERNTPTHFHRPPVGSPAPPGQHQNKEVNLETAIQSKLSAQQNKERAKPRSKSLIWRPGRKPRSSTELSECRIS